MRALSFFAPIISSPCLFKRVTTTGSLDSMCTVKKRPGITLGVMYFPGYLSPRVLKRVLQNKTSGILRTKTILIKNRSIRSSRPGCKLSMANFIRPSGVCGGCKYRPKSILILAGRLKDNVIGAAIGTRVTSRTTTSRTTGMVTSLGRETGETVRGRAVRTYASIAKFKLLKRYARVTRTDSVALRLCPRRVRCVARTVTCTEVKLIPTKTCGGQRFTTRKLSTKSMRRICLSLVDSPRASKKLLIDIPERRLSYLLTSFRTIKVRAGISIMNYIGRQRRGLVRLGGKGVRVLWRVSYCYSRYSIDDGNFLQRFTMRERVGRRR